MVSEFPTPLYLILNFLVVLILPLEGVAWQPGENRSEVMVQTAEEHPGEVQQIGEQAADAQAGQNQPPETIGELRTAIQRVLQETGTPGAGIAMVDRSGTVWVDGLGKADVEQDIDATEESMFRLASTSKMFISIAVLQLQEEGKLSLKDRVRDLIPEIAFTNRWADTHPIVVEHLLEHTTGWDDVHLPEKVASGEGLSLEEALDIHPHTRTSRWVPGTRTAYSNVGVTVAAYIVEKISGRTFEEYTRQHIFDPLGMETITWILSEDVRQRGVTLYREGRPIGEFEHFIYRPAGTASAAPKEMGKLVAFFLNRGMAGDRPVISERSVQRMETPSTTSGAKAGLKYGYGLGLYTSDHNGYTYYRHGGSVQGGRSDVSYLPEHGVGYSLQINSGNRQALYRIRDLIRDFQTRNLPAPEPDRVAAAGPAVYPPPGFYQQINPRGGIPIQLPSLTAEQFWHEGDTLYSRLPAFIGNLERFVPVGGAFYRSQILNKTNMVLVDDPLHGKVLEISGSEGGTLTLGRVSGVLVVGRIMVPVLWVLFLAGTVLMIPLWGYRYRKGTLTGADGIRVLIWPFVPAFFLVTAVIFAAAGSMSGVDLLARPSWASIGIMGSTIAFFVSALYSVVAVLRCRKSGIRRSAFIPAVTLSVLNALLALYLLKHGVIGLMTWA